MNFLITGHTKGIGKAIYDKFGGKGLSKSTGFDISKDSIKYHLQDVDVFVNNAYDNNNPWAQTKILYETLQVKKIICIGSNTTDQSKNWPHPYQSAKFALENSCNQLFYQGYNITLIKLGYVDTERVEKVLQDKIDCAYIVDTIDWILKQKYKIKELTIVP
tara:strand:- start:369 stop:851 length:483 start_codon:yes stop_codon:yes gene_type:complete